MKKLILLSAVFVVSITVCCCTSASIKKDSPEPTTQEPTAQSQTESNPQAPISTTGLNAKTIEKVNKILAKDRELLKKDVVKIGKMSRILIDLYKEYLVFLEAYPQQLRDLDRMTLELQRRNLEAIKNATEEFDKLAKDFTNDKLEKFEEKNVANAVKKSIELIATLRIELYGKKHFVASSQLKAKIRELQNLTHDLPDEYSRIIDTKTLIYTN